MRQTQSFTLVALALLFLCGDAHADPGDDVLVRVVDTGQGLCTVTRMPGPYYMVYDAGVGGRICFDQVREVLGDNKKLDLLVLSHADADHLAAAPDILHKYDVKRIVRTGMKRDTDIWEEVDRKVGREAGAEEFNLTDLRRKGQMLQPGKPWHYGDVTVRFVNGWDVPEEDWNIPPNSAESRTHGSKYRNSVSIVIRLEYAGRAVLFTGDAVGRDTRKAYSDRVEPVFSEKEMLKREDLLRSDVIIAGHHGADDASSEPFIKAVEPTYVVFSAGHNTTYQHPRAATAKRFIDLGVHAGNIFRTDLGDSDGRKEWAMGRGRRGTSDPQGDDHIDIRIDADGAICVSYASDGP